MRTAENTLTPHEQTILHAITTQADPKISQRAQLILNWSIDPEPDRLATATGWRPAQVKHWLQAFGQSRLNIFPPDVLWLASRGLDGSITVNQLCKKYKIDLGHAKHVAQLSLMLFEHTQAIHQLPIERGRLLEAAAILHNAGMSIDQAQHHIVGRDIVIKYKLTGFSDTERDSIACMVLFHRKKVKAEIDRLFATLAPDVQRETLILSALLRVGDGLDYSTDQGTYIQSIDARPDRVDVQIDGPQAVSDAARAQHKSDLWQSIFKVPFTFSIGDQLVELSQTARPHRVRRFGLKPTDLMAEASRSIMAQHFKRVRELELSARAGNEDAIHDLRVAVRRLRVTVRLARSEYKQKSIAPLRSALSEFADRLAAVRDLDVILEHGLTFAQKHRSREAKLDLWLDHLKLRRAAAQNDLTRWLKSKRFHKFSSEFETFANTPQAAVRSKNDRLDSARVSEVMPSLIWEQYGAVRAYEAVRSMSIEQMHALRIEVKRLRDGLEFFSEVLGQETHELIDLLVRLQDHLGALQDAIVTQSLLAEYLIEQPKDAGALAYQATVDKEIKARRSQFPEVWKPIINKPFRKLLARLLGEV
ncbi:MAG TPA: CHAD domain-containing protein [Anaerolineae bacterium]|nr:CHAD domain-containing protein [Anaerolineae bacterium]